MDLLQGKTYLQVYLYDKYKNHLVNICNHKTFNNCRNFYYRFYKECSRICYADLYYENCFHW